jgi:predicted RNase H-like HicB family nuclease
MTKQEIFQEALAVKYPVEIHHLEEEDGSNYVFAFHPDFGSSMCSATGDTIDEALKALDNVRADILDHLVNKGVEIPKPYSFFGSQLACHRR